MKILDTIPEINMNDKIALLLRHADRDSIPNNEFGNEVLLNNKGIRHAIEYGVGLKPNKISKIYTSPIRRCVQTAEYIMQGYGKEFPIIETVALGDPGLHVVDAKKVGAYYLKYGFWEMYDAFKNRELTDGFPTFEELKVGINDFIEHNSEEGLTLYITHDAVIAFYAYVANIKEYTELNWVNYLEGLTFKLN